MLGLILILIGFITGAVLGSVLGVSIGLSTGSVLVTFFLGLGLTGLGALVGVMLAFVLLFIGEKRETNR